MCLHNTYPLFIHNIHSFHKTRNSLILKALCNFRGFFFKIIVLYFENYLKGV